MASQESSAGFEQVVLVNSECANCGGSAQYLCQACGQTGPRYCSLKCQSDHWAKEHATVCAGAHSDTESEDHDSERSSRNLKRTSSKVYSRGTVAQLINFRKRRSTPEPPASPTLERLPNSNDLPPVYDAVQADEFRFYMHQVYRIIKPVVLCIVLSILWVKLAKAPSYFVIGSNTSSSSSNQGNDDSPSSSISSSVYMAGILIGQIIVATIVIVFLFKYGFTKILVGFFMFVVLFPLGFMSYLLISSIISIFSIPLDYITLIFALWNFTAVGLISVFWKGPLLLQQAYLTIMSSLMAFSLTGLNYWTTWILLALLAIWDLIAVLCPFGPLRILVESSKENQHEIPALLYSVNAIWLMAAPKISNQIQPGTSSLSPLTQSHTDSSPSSFISPPNSASTTNTSIIPPVENMPLSENLIHNSYSINASNNSEANTLYNSLHTDENLSGNNNESSDDDEEDERNGLKLGLGDFVFYSVLIAQAALYDWVTTIACVVAVLTGLNATIFLLAIYQKALPALPISIAFGMLFYFVSRLTLVPYVTNLGIFLVAV